jgi:hypothetical protein
MLTLVPGSCEMLDAYLSSCEMLDAYLSSCEMLDAYLSSCEVLDAYLSSCEVGILPDVLSQAYAGPNLRICKRFAFISVLLHNSGFCNNCTPIRCLHI